MWQGPVQTAMPASAWREHRQVQDTLMLCAHSLQAGGLSGRPLLDMSTDVLRQMYALTKGKMLIIGCGGITTGEDAYRKIRAGGFVQYLITDSAH